MTMMSKLVFAYLATLLAVLPAHAQSAPTAGHGSVGALFGYGFKGGVRLGMGMRAGSTLPANIYLGGTFVYHLGKSESTTLGNVSANVHYFGIEGGYDIAAVPVVIRPYLGLGDATAKLTMPRTCVAGVCEGGSESSSNFAVWPGSTLLYPMRSAFIGADARFLIVSGYNYNTFCLFATGGLQF